MVHVEFKSDGYVTVGDRVELIVDEIKYTADGTEIAGYVLAMYRAD